MAKKIIATQKPDPKRNPFSQTIKTLERAQKNNKGLRLAGDLGNPQHSAIQVEKDVYQPMPRFDAFN